MPVTPTYPGVYIEEVPSGVRAITGVATSIAAFVDFFTRGPMNRAVQVRSFGDVERELGGLDQRSEASYALQHFFLNGGSEAWVVRVASGTPQRASVALLDAVSAGGTSLTARAADEGSWGNRLLLRVDPEGAGPDRFALTATETGQAGGRLTILAQETFRGLSVTATLPSGNANPAYVETVVNEASRLVRLDHTPPAARPAASGTLSGAFPGPLALPAIANPLAPRRLAVTFTIDGTSLTTAASLGVAAIGSLEEAALRLEGAIRAANVLRPEWAAATVRVSGDRLQVVAGPAAPAAIVTFGPAGAEGALLADAATVADLNLEPADVAANVAFYRVGATVPIAAQGAGVAGADGTPPDAAALIGTEAVEPPTGLFALNRVPLVNLLCLPRIARVSGTTTDFPLLQVDTVVTVATAYAQRRRAFLILDTPSNVTTVPQVRDWLGQKATLRDRNVAFYFPRVRVADPLDEFRSRSFGPSGLLAGLYARTDAARGVWKAPAGIEATLRGVQQLDYRLTDLENGTLNPLGVNALRSLPVHGNVCWGARTLEGSDEAASEWKYVPVRRLALFLEESLYRGTQWVVFEPNDEPLWAQIRLNVGAFMQGLFRQGAFQGRTPAEAYFVRCDGDTTTQADVDRGIVNVVVGFAPLKPAEFVIIRIQQMAGQRES